MSFSESCCCTHRCAMTTISTTTASSSSSSRGRVFHRRTHQSRRLLRTTEVVQAQTSSSNDAMEEETFDVVIIGSGIGGLSAAALLAKYDLKVCCVESHEHAGVAVLSKEQPGASEHMVSSEQPPQPLPVLPQVLKGSATLSRAQKQSSCTCGRPNACFSSQLAPRGLGARHGPQE